MSLKFEFAKTAFAAIFAITFAAVAAPHDGDRFDLKQPDGSFVPVIVWGDEFYQEVETPDGFTLIRDADGWICYARLNDDGTEYASTGVRYTGAGGSPPIVEKRIRINAASRLKKHRGGREALGFDNSEMIPRDRRRERASSGLSRALSEPEIVTGLTIIVAFPEGNSYDINGATGQRENATTGNLSRQDVYDFCNREGGFNGANVGGSVRDWFLDVSNGRMDYYNIVTPVIYVDSAKSFYDRGDMGTETGNRPHVRAFVGSAIRQVKKLVDDGTLDISSLTTEGPNNRGIYTVTALNILYFGSATQGWSKGLWPHAGTNAGGRADTIDIGGKRVVFNRYQMMSLGTEATPPSLATFAHENGHMVMHWPDLYPYPSSNIVPPRYVGGYCVMATGNRNNPTPPNPYFSYLAGWIDVADIAGMGDTLLSHVSNSRFAYRYVRNSREGYFIEARRRAGRSANIPGEGLLIWHVDTSGRNISHDEVDYPLVRLVRADGVPYDTANPGANAPFRAGGGSRNTAFGNATTPAAMYYDGTFSNLDISEISAVGDTMTFRVGRRDGPVTYHLWVENGVGSGYYLPNTTVDISAPAINSAGRYFFKWTSDNANFRIEPDNIYARETRVTVGASAAEIAPEYARGHTLPGRLEADTAALRAGPAIIADTAIGATGGRYMRFGIAGADTAQYALYAVDIAEDGLYKLSYRMRLSRSSDVGTLYLLSETDGITLDAVSPVSVPVAALITLQGGEVNLRKGSAVWRIEAPPGTVARLDWLNVERIGDMTSVLSSNREMRQSFGGDDIEYTVIVPAVPQSSTFTAGPNPANRSGAVNFYYRGQTIRNGSLTIYDAAGNVVRRIYVDNNVIGNGLNNGINNRHRMIGSWDMKDAGGRIVSDGAYLVRGTLIATNGKRNGISVIIGVR